VRFRQLERSEIPTIPAFGPLTTSVADAALLLDAIGGHDPMDSTSIPVDHPKLIDVIDQGVEGMRVGGRRKLTIPSALAYGARGAGGVIAPHEPLVFVVDLLSVD